MGDNIWREAAKAKQQILEMTGTKARLPNGAEFPVASDDAGGFWTGTEVLLKEGQKLSLPEYKEVVVDRVDRISSPDGYPLHQVFHAHEVSQDDMQYKLRLALWDLDGTVFEDAELAAYLDVAEDWAQLWTTETGRIWDERMLLETAKSSAIIALSFSMLWDKWSEEDSPNMPELSPEQRAFYEAAVPFAEATLSRLLDKLGGLV